MNSYLIDNASAVQDTAQTLTNILLPAFDAMYKSTVHPVPAPPLAVSAYAGDYTPATGMRHTINPLKHTTCTNPLLSM